MTRWAGLAHFRGMRYMGSKARLAPALSRAILERVPSRALYVEPFLGSAAMFSAVAPSFDRAVGADAHPDLAEMWRAVAAGWVPPSVVSREEYAALRYAEVSALRGFVGFGASFGGKWFGGYARHDPRPGRRAAADASAASVARRAPALVGREIRHADYRELGELMSAGTVVYCDPPYAGTTAYAGVPPFDHGAFWECAAEWAGRGADVFVSEFAAPEGWQPVFEVSHRTVLTAGDNSRRSVERLFTLA